MIMLSVLLAYIMHLPYPYVGFVCLPLMSSDRQVMYLLQLDLMILS